MRTIGRAALAAAMLWGMGMSDVGAGELVDRAAQAEELAGQGDAAGAYDAMHEALVALNAAIPLSIRRAVFVAEPPQGYGVYNPRETNGFASTEALVAYVEPIGVTWAPIQGLHRAEMTVDFEILTPDGQVLANQNGFAEFNFTSRARNTELMTHLTLELTGAPPGKYVLRYVYNDKNSGESASIELPFEIVAE